MGARGDRSTGAGRLRAAWLAAPLAVLAIVAGCTQDVDPPVARMETNRPSAFSLEVSDDCSELVDRTREQLLAAVGPVRDEVLMEADGFAAGEAPAASRSADDSGAAAAPPTTASSTEAAADLKATGGDVVAGTNVQEAGVDEGDLVKTDGRRIVTVVDGMLRVTRLDGSPAVDGVLDLRSAGATEMFLRGDQAVVIGSGGAGYGRYPDDVVPLPAPEPLVGPTAGSESDSRAEAPTSPAATLPATTSTTVPATTRPADTTTTTSTTTASTTTTSTTTTSTTTSTTTVPPVTVPPQRFPVGVTVTLVDLSEDTAPRIVESTEVEGSLVATRMVDGTVRVVVRTSPMVMERLWSSPDPRAAVDAVDAGDVLPRRVEPSGEVEPLGSCSDVLTTPAVEVDTPTSDSPAPSQLLPGDRAASYSPPPEQVTVLTVREDLADLAPVTVQGSAETTYASTGALFVASTSWWGDGPATAVHRFDLTGEGGATYTGSGVVHGSLLDQYSLSERDGHLRIVTTTQGTSSGDQDPVGTAVDPDPGDVVGIEPMPLPVPSTEGRLTVLRPDAEGALGEVGHVEDLGVGETVRSVRFLDDLAYVVTFRQTDPLYAVDLSDPTAPRVLGELKIPGFSEYLHPLGDGLLLGIGRDADESTGRDRGFKASLFDVSDPTAPVELDTVVRTDTHSLVSQEALAFSWDPVRRQAVLPISTQCSRIECARADWSPRSSALVLGVEGQGLTERAELAHGDGLAWNSEIRRSVVVDDDLWTVSGMGLGRSSASSPTTVELLAY